ncbi:hypothetical protein ACFW9D_21105 [Streptomyces sp. NPDC059524]|uniref:hypothetical protein n=1 Tax=Streptomyces sp. NPDC059524 TaxID=3346856 RepID=UPI00367E266C
MDLDALRFANFTSLDEAVADWKLLVQHLVDLKKDAEDGLHKAANQANWAGVNAQVSKEFIGKTAGEFADAHTQATTVHNILSDTRDELKQHKKDLEAAIDRGLKKNLTVMDTGGGGFTVTMNIHPDRAAKGTTVPEHSESDVTALRDEVQGILQKATDSDASAAKVLKAVADTARMGFSDASYKDRDEAADAVEAAEDLAAIAGKKPEDLTPADFDKINAGLSKYKDDPLFAERFATQLGPKKTLEFWEGISDPQVNMEVGSERLDQLGDLQRNLSMTLATATRSDTAAMAGWKSDMIRLGDQTIGPNGLGPDGFQVMSNLMRAGDYDDDFLKSYGTKLMETERKLTGDGEHDNLKWRPGFSTPWLNRMGEDSGADPLTGFLKGLSNSPDAATDFFNEEYLPKDGDDRKEPVDNFKYLFEDRKWPEEQNLDGDDLHTGQNNLALALEAATTGHPAGELPTADTPAHTADQARLMRELVDSVSEDPDRLKDNGYMSDSFGQIGAEYLPDIHRAMADGPAVAGDDSGWDKLYPLAGEDAKLDHNAVARFLVTTSQNPEGYAALNVGEKAYTASLMDYHLNPDLPEDQRYPHDAKDTITSLSRKSGEFNGLLAQGRQEAVLGPAGEKDGDFDHAVSQKKNVISGIVGTGVGIGTSFIASPVVGAAAGGAAGTVTSVVMEAFFKDDEGHYRSEAGHDVATRWETIKDSATNANYAAANEAAKAHHANYTDQIDTWVSEGTATGFNDANTDIHAMAKDLDTEIPS